MRSLIYLNASFERLRTRSLHDASQGVYWQSAKKTPRGVDPAHIVIQVQPHHLKLELGVFQVPIEVGHVEGAQILDVAIYLCTI